MVGSKENYKFDQGVKRLIIIPCSSYSLMKKISFFFLTYCDPFLINSLSIEKLFLLIRELRKGFQMLGEYCYNFHIAETYL